MGRKIGVRKESAEYAQRMKERVDAIGGNPHQRSEALREDEVAAHRRIYCRHYDRCIDLSEAKQWESFSCEECVIREELTIEERREEAEIMVRIFRDKGFALGE